MFLLPAGLAALDALLLARLPESVSSQRSACSLPKVRQVFSHRWAVFLIVLAVFEGAAMLTFITFLAPAIQVQGVSSAVAGLVVAAGAAVFLALQGLKVILTRERMSPVATIATGGTVLAGALLLAAAFQNVATILAASVLIGIAAVAALASNHRFGVLFLSGVCIAVPVTAVAAVARARFRVEPEFSVAAEATARSEGRR